LVWHLILDPGGGAVGALVFYDGKVFAHQVEQRGLLLERKVGAPRALFHFGPNHSSSRAETLISLRRLALSLQSEAEIKITQHQLRLQLRRRQDHGAALRLISQLSRLAAHSHFLLTAETVREKYCKLFARKKPTFSPWHRCAVPL